MPIFDPSVDDAEEHPREFVSLDKPKKSKYQGKSYTELYGPALNGDHDALDYFAFLYIEHKEKPEVINELCVNLDKIIQTNSDPRRLNACFMRALLYYETKGIVEPLSPKVQELFDEIIKSPDAFLKGKVFYFKGIDFADGGSGKKDAKKALENLNLSVQMGNADGYMLLKVFDTKLKKNIISVDSKLISDTLDKVKKILEKTYFGTKPDVKLSTKEELKLSKEINDFMENAQKIIDLNVKIYTSDKNSLPLENFLADTCKNISGLAAKTFTHRHQVRRILADVFFIPLGFATLGLALIAKKMLTGSFTFYGSQTRREDIVDDEIKSIKKPKI